MKQVLCIQEVIMKNLLNGSDTDEDIKLLFEPSLQKYEENLQNKMRGSDFEFDGINFLYYNFYKTNINRGVSYIDSPKWLKDKKSAINPKNNDDKCFQYAVTLALNLDNTDNHPETIHKKELKRIAEEKSGHLDYKDFLKIYNYCTREPYSFMLIDTRPTASVTFKKKL